VDAEHRRFAVFSHFRGVERGTGDDAGNIRIIPFGDGHWFWFIPLAGGVTSIGAVVTKEVIRLHRDDVQGYFDRTIDDTHALKRLMSGAEQVEPVRTIADFSYESARFVGDRFLIVGDAAAFIDPVFSSGVLMAMSSARDAAKAIHSAFQKDDFSARALRAYEREHRRRVRTIFRLIRAYYRPAFLEMFMNPSDVLELKAAVTTMLAGNADLKLRLRWRVELFFIIGWLRGYMRSNRTMSTACSHGCSIHPAGV
jgi:flavin-dependent dehydrogenase